MMTGKLWWERLVNSARFLDDVIDQLLEDKSVLLRFHKEIPWEENLIQILTQKLQNATSSRTFESHDVFGIDSPGEYLLKSYCSPEEQRRYWPTTYGSHERFLAQSEVTTLNHRYVCITGVKPDKAAAWTASIAEYLKNCESADAHGVFILLIKDANVAVPRQLTAYKYDDYVTDYDCMMLCLTLVSDLKCSRTEKMYLCEVASNIAHNDAEIAAMLVARRIDLINDPYRATEAIFTENNVAQTDLTKRVRSAVWEAQIKLVFPRIESFRTEIIKKYRNRLQQFLPIHSSNHDVIDKPEDLEIGQLYYICNENRASRITDISEFEILDKMRHARNTLAHLDILSCEQLAEIGVI